MPTPSLLIVPARFKTGKLYSQIPTSGAGDFTVTRNTTATRLNDAGALESVASGIPRLDYSVSGFVTGCPALLVEPAATNSIRNNSMSGAVTGTPGTLPTNYSTSLAGLTRTIVGTGTENGVAYMDIRFSGTSTGGAVVIQEETSTFITAASGQVWTHSVYAKVIANVLNMPSIRVGMYEYTSGGVYLTEGSNPFTLTSSLNRFSFTRTLANASTARVAPTVQWVVNNGTSYDFTVRIGYPQMETGSVATSVIPTTAGTGSRSADVISVSGAVSGSIGQTEGTIYAEVDVRNIADSKAIIQSDDGTTDNRLILFIGTAPNRIQFLTVAAGANSVVSGSIATGINKIAASYFSGSVQLYLNGSFLASGTPTAFPTVTRNNFSLGTRISAGVYGAQFNDRIRAAALYTTRLNAAELATLTTL